MNEKYTINRAKFEFHKLEGTHYEIGKRQGEIIKKYDYLTKFYTSGKFNEKKSLFTDFEEVHDFFDEHCPGFNDEAKGFADVLDIELERINIYDFPTSMQNNCSQMAALPHFTENGHTFAGRSYEWNHLDEDLQLRITSTNGKYKHIGFAGMIFGRFEGLNENGLCVTASSGGAWEAPRKNKGVNWALAIRVLLDNCKNVDEALDRLERIPIEGTNNFIITDDSGNAAYLESLDSMTNSRKFENATEKKYIISTNHYNLEEHEDYNKYNNPWLLPNSKARYKFLETTFSKTSKICKNCFIEILTKEFPEGLCCHWYTDGFGTLWSVFFDVMDKEAIICFGPPTHNEWHRFSLDEEAEFKEYEVIFPDKRIEM